MTRQKKSIRYGPMARPDYGKACLFLPLMLCLSGCMNNGIEWSELSFTREKPNRTDVIGTWVPTAATINDLKQRGGYVISKHELVLRADGTFAMVNMPDWWSDGFGQSKKTFESGSGKWQFIGTIIHGLFGPSSSTFHKAWSLM